MPLKIIFAGTPAFAATILKELLTSEHQIVAVYTQPDRPAGRGRKLTKSPVKELAENHGIPVFQPQTLKDTAVQRALSELGADVMVVAAYGLMLPPAVLQLFKYGCINVHASLLPRWRGAAPIQCAILAGDTVTGITIMQMEAGLDTGAMLLKAQIPIADNDTSDTLHEKLSELGAKTLLESLKLLATNNLNPEIQDNSQASYAKKINKQDAQLNWNTSIVELDRKIRGFNPWPVAYTHLQNEVVRIWKATIIGNGVDKTPGTILKISSEGLDVATADGILRIQQLQLPGGKILSVGDILNSKAALFAVNQVLN